MTFQSFRIAKYDGVVMLAPPVAVEITSISINPSSLTDLYHEYQTRFGIGYCGEPFTITITFSNPHDYDVWLAPDFAFGDLTGEPLEYVGTRELMVRGFTPAPVLYYPLFLESEYIWGDYSYSGATWYELWQPGHAGSNMTQYVYDPEGIPLVTGAQAWLKVPAKGQATTQRQCNLGVKAGLLTSGSLFGWTHPYGWVWKFYNNCVPGQEYLVKYVKSSDRPFDPTKPMDAYEVYEPIPRVFDICAVATGFYIVYQPGWGTFQGKPVNYKKIAYNPLASAIEAMVRIAAFHGDYERDGTVYTFRWQKYIGTVDATQLKFEDATPPDWW